MDDERARRIGQNEALFRQVNERIEDVNRAFSPLTERMDVVCECGSASCADRIQLSVADYERVRADPTHFVIREGHEIADVEEVVERSDGWTVVRKAPGVPAEVARELDPRS